MTQMFTPVVTLPRQLVEELIQELGQTHAFTMALLQNCLDAPALPPLTEEMAFILGRPNFACAPIAQALRRHGQVIATKAEAEQAAFIWWGLTLYLEHGDGWRALAEQEMNGERPVTGAPTPERAGE